MLFRSIWTAMMTRWMIQMILNLLNVSFCEILTDRGLVTYIVAWNESFMVYAVLDFGSSNLLVISKFFEFVDEYKGDNCSEKIADIVLNKAVKKYSELISKQETTSKKVQYHITDKSNRTPNSNGIEYTYEMRQIEGYVRNLPTGQTASEDRVVEAKKCGFILRNDQTFVKK